MEANFIWDYLFASTLMALGIGMDVAIVTASRAWSLRYRQIALVWVIGVSLTHTLLPMVGYLFTYFSIKLHPLLTPTIGLVASGLIFFYLVTELKSHTNPEGFDLEADSQVYKDTGSDIGLDSKVEEERALNCQKVQSDASNRIANLRQEHSFNRSSETTSKPQLMGTIGLIIAVSWDALWSGPAKSAQVTDWPEFWVWASFVIVGLIITLMSILALKLGHTISDGMKSNKRVEVSNSNLVMIRFVAALVQYGVIGYFGLLALTSYTFGLTMPWWLLLQLSFTLIMVVLLVVGKPTRVSRVLNTEP